ncbi:ATP-dependent DNA helicase MER3 [Carex littledalei]|uniref:DNA 3'-5' helicase n=1 Tax=Carex littledalei TaxID=544730 RepID=A0A833QFL2_9POAL|nr:ATP-dependent DNA helicase MER3 [Carex littledalei]
MGSFNDPYALRSVLELPAVFRPVFNFRYFNSLQSECFSVCFLCDKNMVISAPTGSGKTVLFELSILRLLSRFFSPDGRFNHVKGVLKTIYIAPSKALVQEKVRDWKQKFGSLGINCLEMTGDNEFFNFKSIQDSDIILTTPEKFDAVTRHGVRGGGLSFFGDIALVLIDEVHLLSDPRGAALEAVVSRIKMLSRVPGMSSDPISTVRFIAVSATIPNIGDIGEWLQVPQEGIKRFGEEMRPVKLTTKVFGTLYVPYPFKISRSIYLPNLQQNNNILMQNSRGKSALVFCSTRKGAQEAAQCLSKTAASLAYSNPFIKSMQQKESLKEASISCSDKQLQSCIVNGVGYHSGGLGLKDRSLVEQLFLKGDLIVLCTTNTLALGINLPAHTVIIKSTQYFNKEKGLYLEYERSMILQMCGRAGRPPFDDTGTVIIMTRKETVHLYENLLSGCEMVESQLLSCAVEHLNAEIVQMTVSDISLAIEWLKCSYLYIRIKKNPENYGIKKGTPRDHLEKHLREICVQKIHELSDYGLVWTDEDGFLLKPLDPGKMMTKYYLKFDTMKLIVKAPGSSSLEDVLRVICHSAEISWIQLRRNDKKILNDIHTDKEGRLRFHVLAENGKRKKRIMTREEKIFVLANDCLTGDPLIQDLSLSQQEASSMCSNGCRIAKCMKEYFIYKKSYKAAMNSMLLAKCLYQKLWDSSQFLLKQLPGIGIMTAKALQSAGITNFESLEAADPRKIEILTGRNYPFGNHIKESLLSLPPKIAIHVEEVAIKRGGIPKVAVTLTRLERVYKSNKYHYADMVVGSEEDNTILFHEKISPYSFIVSVPCPQNARVTLKIHLVYEEYVGLDVHTKHTISCKPYLAYGVQKFEETTAFDTLSKDICAVSPQATRITATAVASKPNPLSKEVFVIEDDEFTNPQDKACKVELPVKLTYNLAEMEGPSFDLILDEPTEDITETDPQEETTEGKSTTEETIFDHIRKKSLNFPTLTLSKSMDCSYEPLLLKRRKIEQNPIELYAKAKTQLDPEPSKVQPEKFNKWLMDSSEKHIDCKVASKSSFCESGRRSAWDDIIGYFQGMDPSKGVISPPPDVSSRLKDYCRHISVDEQGQECFKSVFSLLFE